MRLPLVLGLVAVLTLSCQENKTAVQKPLKNIQGEVKDLSKEEHISEIKNLSIRVQKTLLVKVDNTKKAKRILSIIKESRLGTDDNKKLVMKVMDKLDLPIEDRKEIIHIMDIELAK